MRSDLFYYYKVLVPFFILGFFITSSCHQSGVQQKRGKKESIKSNASIEHQVQFKDSINTKDLKVQSNTALKDTNLGLMVKDFYEKLTNAYRSHELDVYRNTNIGVFAFLTWIKKDTFENKIVMYQIANKRAVFKYEKYKVPDQDQFGKKIFKDSSFYSSIIFYSHDNTEVISTFDIQADNPFKKLEYPSIRYNEWLGGEISPALSREEQDTITYEEVMALADSYYSRVAVAYIDEYHTCIIYILEPLNKRGSLGEYSTVVILDTVGQVIISQPIYKDVVGGGRGVHLTPNGKYMAVIYGGFFGFSGFTRPGLRIYDTENMQIIHQEEFEGSDNRFRSVGSLVTIKTIDKGLGMENFIDVVIDRNSTKYAKDSGMLIIDPEKKKIHELYSNSNTRIITSNYYTALKELDWNIRAFETP